MQKQFALKQSLTAATNARVVSTDTSYACCVLPTVPDPYLIGMKAGCGPPKGIRRSVVTTVRHRILPCPLARMPEAMSTRRDFLSALSNATLSFPDNTAARRMIAGTFGMEDYHRLLLSLYHVAHAVPDSTRLAAARCPDSLPQARQCLEAHALRVAPHAGLLRTDLTASGYAGPAPENTTPDPAAAAYITFNATLAETHPVARLAVIAVMDAISGSFSGNYIAKLLQSLPLRPSQIGFFFRQDDPATRPQPVLDVLEHLPLTAGDWAGMIDAATAAARLYRDVYSSAVAAPAPVDGLRRSA